MNLPDLDSQLPSLDEVVEDLKAEHKTLTVKAEEVEAEPTEEIVHDTEVEEGDAETSDEDVKEPEPRVYTDVEKEAMAKGWKPDGVPGKVNKTAEQFLASSELYEMKAHLSKENKRLRQLVEHLAREKEAEKKAAYDKYKQDLTAKRVQAIYDGDAETVFKLDEEIAKLTAPVQINNLDPEVEEANDVFMSRNKSWFRNDQTGDFEQDTVHAEMTQYALELAQMVEQRYPNKPPLEKVAVVEKMVAKKYSDHPSFVNEKRTTPAAVSGSTRAAASPQKATKSVTLSADQEKAYQTMKRVCKNMPALANMTREYFLNNY